MRDLPISLTHLTELTSMLFFALFDILTALVTIHSFCYWILISIRVALELLVHVLLCFCVQSRHLLKLFGLMLNLLMGYQFGERITFCIANRTKYVSILL